MNTRVASRASITALSLAFVWLGSCRLSAQQKPEYEVQTRSNVLGMTLIESGSSKILMSAQKESGLVGYRISKNRLHNVCGISKTELAGLDAMSLFQNNDYLYVALGDFFGRESYAGFAIIDVRVPEKPRVLATWKSREKLQGAAAIVANERTAFLGAMSKGVLAFDISTKSEIKHVGTFLPDIHFPRKNPGKVQMPNARGLFLEANRLYVAFDAGGLRILDISTPSGMKEIGRYINRFMGVKQQAYNNLVVHNGYAFVGVDYAGLEILDLRNPKRIRQVAWWNPWNAETLSNLWFNSPGHINEVRLDVAKKRVYLSGGDIELASLDVSDVKKPKLIKQFGKEKNKQGVWGISLSGDKVFAGYIKTIVPFQGHWSGIKVFKR